MKNHRSSEMCVMIAGAVLAVLPGIAAAATTQWDGYAGNAQHTALSSVASQPLDMIHWQTPVDLNPQYSGSDLYIHYGSPAIDAANTVMVPVKTGATGGFQIEAFNGQNGNLLWTQPTNYILPSNYPPFSWTPSYSPNLSTFTTGNVTQTRLYYAAAGGAVDWISSLDSNTPTAPTQAFVGGSFNSNIIINTPLTSDGKGNVYFGFLDNSNAGGPASGLARIDANGNISTIAANSIAGGLSQVATNSAPAVASDGSIYVAMNNGGGSYVYYDSSPGQLVKINFNSITNTLQATANVALTDPKSGLAAPVSDSASASPMIGPDGQVYYGVLDTGGTSRGWLEHFTANLQPSISTPSGPQALPIGGFGWDDTPSVVPASMVPSYTGTSSYLLMVKYNNYIETGGQGQNMIAIIDPNAAVTDNQRNNSTGSQIMQVIESILGPTPNPNGGVDEWCINSAVVDPATDSILVNSEDGHLYRWYLATNTFTQVIDLAPPTGEAYTPTLIGPDGTVYAINNATLFAVGASTPEPGTIGLVALGGLMLLRRRRTIMR